jgi:hypothetical protein
MLTGIDRRPGFLIRFAPLLGLALIPVLLALGNGKFAFDPAISEVKPGGNERMPLDLRLCHEPANFFLVHQQLTGAGFIVVREIAVGVRTDMQVEEKRLPVLDEAIGVLEIRFSFADRFDFSPAEGHACLEFFEQEIVVAGDAVVRSIALSRGDGVSRRSLFLRSGAVRRYDSVAALARHGGNSLRLSS